MIEGGLAGTVNLNTRKPFDNKGLHICVRCRGNYGDFEKKWAPTGSLLVSNTWETPAAAPSACSPTCPIRASAAASTASRSPISRRATPRSSRFQSQGGQQICRNQLPGDTDYDDPCLPAGSPLRCALRPAGRRRLRRPAADCLRAARRPVPHPGFRPQARRHRACRAVGIARSDSVLTAQFIRSHTTNAWGEHTFETAPDLSEYNTYPLGCQQNGNGPDLDRQRTTRAECRIDARPVSSGNDQGNGTPRSASVRPTTNTMTTACSRAAISRSRAAAGAPPTAAPATATACRSGGLQQSLSRRQVLRGKHQQRFRPERPDQVRRPTGI